MPPWPEVDGHEVVVLDGWTTDADRPLTDADDATFLLRFTAAAPAPGEEVVLRFGGIATLADVALDGTPILHSESMFAEHVVDVGALLADEREHELVVRCHALAPRLAQRRRPRQRWRTRLVADGGLRFWRTALTGRAPSLAGGREPAPVVGPWRPVWLERRRRVVVEALALRPALDGATGVLDVRARLRPLDAAARIGAVTVIVDGPSGEHRVALEHHDDGHATGVLAIADVARWWPHTHGTPALHEVTLWVDDVAVRCGRTGFRALGPGPDHDVAAESLALTVNGVAIFARGAVWTAVAPAQQRATLTAARDAGLNLIRVPGTGTYADDGFHDLCDELGLLVWQDFMFANLDYPIADADFRAAVEAEARQELARVAGRPSLAVLCGGSEVEQQAAMAGVDLAAVDVRGELFGELLPRWAREAGAAVPYVPNAPCGGVLPFHPGTGVDNWFGVGGYRRPLADVRAAGVRFASECLAFANVPDGDVADGEGVPRDAGASWDFADVTEHYRAARYGPRPADRALALEQARAVTGELMAGVFGEWRRTASPCAGGIVLWLRDPVPGAGWGLLDHTGAPKPVLRRLAQALAPLAVWITDEALGGLHVHIAHEGAAPLDAVLRVALIAGDRVLEERRLPVTLAARATTAWDAEAVLGRFADASYAYRFGPLAHDAVLAVLEAPDGAALTAPAAFFPDGPPAAGDPGLTASAAPGADGTVAVTVATRGLAHAVRVAASGHHPRGDLVTLEPGATHVVTLVPDGSGAPWRGATVTAVNAAVPLTI